MTGERCALLALLAGAGCLSKPGPPGSSCDPPPPVDAPVSRTSRFVLPTGDSSANGLERDMPTTLDNVWSVVQPGEEVVLLPGTYDALAPTVSGLDGQEIVIRADVEGTAIIDGSTLGSRPCTIDGVSELVIEGIRCVDATDDPLNPGEPVLSVWNSTEIVLRRITVREDEAIDDGVSILASHGVLLEDVAVGSVAKNQFAVAHSSRIKLRRCYGRYYGAAPAVDKAVFFLQDSVDVIVENAIATTGDRSDQQVAGFVIVAYDEVAADNRIFASIAHGTRGHGYVIGGTNSLSGTVLRDVVALDTTVGVLQRNDVDVAMERLTMASTDEGLVLSPDGTVVGANLERSVFARSNRGLIVDEAATLTARANWFVDVLVAYTGVEASGDDRLDDPGFELARFGLRGAYLVRPAALTAADAGAEIVGRTVDRVLTSQPLWPWPMEDRIDAELQGSVTYESGGGLWKQLPTDCP